ncbi:MAG: hypothetical protein WC593_15680 [Methanoregula sp.]
MEASDVFKNVVPFTGDNLPVTQEVPTVLAEATAQREVAEVQAAMIIAKRFPRNQAKAVDRIMVSCQRPTLAESALYSYARGGTDITGPSIRLAEAIAQQWGNLQIGIRELEQRPGESTMEAYAWDLETNTRQSKVFQVRHIRYTRNKGITNLTDPRDIYEAVANQGSRRLRACILGIIPGDIVEAAVHQCEDTLKAKADISPQAVQKMVDVFNTYNITKEMIEARIQRKLEAITAAQVIALRKIFNSLKDGMSKPGDWFETPPHPEPEKTKKAKTTKDPEPPQDSSAPTPPASTQAEGNGTPTGGTPTQSITDETLKAIKEAMEATGLDLPYEALKLDAAIPLEEFDEETGQDILTWFKNQ